jgi:hypothetical protein
MSKKQTLEELMQDFRFHKNPILNWAFGQSHYLYHTFLKLIGPDIGRVISCLT